MKRILIVVLMIFLPIVKIEINYEQEIYEPELFKFTQKYQATLDSINQVLNNEKLSVLVYEKSTKYEFSPVRVAKQIMIESKGDSSACHPVTKAAGLMQITPSTARLYNLDLSKLLNIGYNLDSGLRILYNNLKQYGTLEKALAAYHGGHKRALRWPHGEQGKTKYYVEQILGD